ncbi:hypothetical protein [Vibrio sp. PID17_43]|uniref:hypothetical protein n=1 Tax=Vibrio sp. PID17_43 TaxID=1583451 RepID=UPI000BFFD0DA|nr:hypothetical protein [Vibrio sp. PID17_43]PHJ40015.1 hypothetical protein AK965_19200 [Vibrio sp. PID17_43]
MSKSNAKIVTPPSVQLSEKEMLELVDSLSSINISDLLRDEKLKSSYENRFSGFNAKKVFQTVFMTTATS